MGNTKAEYQSKSILEVLTLAHEKQLLLPDIQREYVWEINQIEELFESILQEYPIGSFIFWKTSRKAINEQKPNLYYFFCNFKKDETTNDPVPEKLSEEHDYYIVLDGQQRITSLYIALYGYYHSFAGGRGRQKKNPENWRKKELYYDLNSLKALDEESKKFYFLEKKEVADNKQYFKISELLEGDDPNIINDKLDSEYAWISKDPEYKKKVRNDLTKLFLRLRDDKIIHYYSIENANYDDTLDIFVRINSSGTKLSKADLIFSTLIKDWEGVKKEDISEFLKNINVQNRQDSLFRFTKDYLMRFALLAVGINPRLKIEFFKQDTIKKIRDNWEKIKESLSSLSKIFKVIGICDAQILSYNATMIVAYYIFKGGSIDTKNPEALKNVQKYLWIAFAKNLFIGSSDTSLSNIKNAIDRKIESSKSDFPLTLFSDTRLIGGRNFIVTESDIDDWLAHKKGDDKVFLLLSLLYPNLKLNEIEFHQDHCHPESVFRKDKILEKIVTDKEKIKEWKDKKDCLPNLQLLKGSENQSKGDESLKEWFEADPLNHKIEYLPKNKSVSLELENFEEFFEERRKEMKIELMKIFGISASDKNNK